jgi:acetate kinase
MSGSSLSLEDLKRMNDYWSTSKSFHEVGFQYCCKRAAEMLNSDVKELKVVICHLGPGASLCGFDGGKSVNTIRGITLSEGVGGTGPQIREEKKPGLSMCMCASFALDLYTHRLNSLIGSMVASLKGVDALVFTAVKGENTSPIRERVCNTFSFLGTRLDRRKNTQMLSEDIDLSLEGSKVKVFLIDAQKALENPNESK